MSFPQCRNEVAMPPNFGGGFSGIRLCPRFKDIHNIRARTAKVSTDEWKATLEELEKFQKEDARAIVEVLLHVASFRSECVAVALHALCLVLYDLTSLFHDLSRRPEPS